MAVVLDYRVDADVHGLVADLGMSNSTQQSGMKYASDLMQDAETIQPEGGGEMDKKYVCMHDRHGYFVGRLSMGHVHRLSLEYFPDEYACLQAIHSQQWTPRTVH